MQLDNTRTTAITAVAIAIPDPTVDVPTLGYADQVYLGKSAVGWQNAVVTRARWDLNVWDDLGVGDPGSPADEVKPSPAPSDWATTPTVGPGRSFTELFGDDPTLGAVLLFWTVSDAFAIQPGESQLGFQISTKGQTLSNRALPFVTFGDGELHGPGHLSVVPEPSAGALGAIGLAALAARRRR